MQIYEFYFYLLKIKTLFFVSLFIYIFYPFILYVYFFIKKNIFEYNISFLYLCTITLKNKNMSNNSSNKTEFVKLKKLTFINYLIEDKIKSLSDDINNSELKKNQEQLSPDLQKDLNKIFKLFISELSDIRTKIKESNACIEKDFGIKISPKERKNLKLFLEMNL